MPAEITRQSVAEYNIISPGAEVMDDVQQAPTGSYRGEAVRASTDVSKLADAAEEIGMALEARGSDRRPLGLRSVKPGRGTTFDTVANVRDYLEKLPNMPREDELVQLVDAFGRLQDAMLQGGGGSGGDGPTRDDVLAALTRFDPDVSHQYAALELMREHFEATGATPDLLGLIDEARQLFLQGDIARDVHAGFAVARVAAERAATMETDPASARDAYRAMVREQPNIGQLFDTLVQFDVHRNVEAAVETFTLAAGHDLASTGPSTDPAHLHALLTELGKLKQMQTVIDGMRLVLQQTDRTIPARERGADTLDQTSRFLNYAARPAAGPADARKVLGHFEQASLPAQIVFLNGLCRLHKEVPDAVMPSVQARAQQAGALATLRDTAVAEEERAFSASVG